LLTFFAVPIGALFVWLYFQFGLTVVFGAVVLSGLSILGILIALWEKVNNPLTRRLEYLNQHAFTPLAEWCKSRTGYRISIDFDTASNAVEALKAHRTYLTAGLYPKKLLHFTEWLVQNTPEYEQLWSDLQRANTEWIQGRLAEWTHVGSNPDMSAMISLLGFNTGFPVRPEVTELLRPFLRHYRETNEKQLKRFVALHGEFLNTQSTMLTILKMYMDTNMLHKPSIGQPP